MKHTLEDLMADEIQEKIDNNSEEIAKRLIKKQMPSNDISEVTHVTLQRLKQLAASLGVSLVTA